MAVVVDRLLRLRDWAARWQPSGRQRMAAAGLVVAAMAAGLWRVETTSRAVGAEAEARAVAICQAFLDERDADRDAFLDMLTRGHADPEAFRIVTESFDARPAPPACAGIDMDT